MKITKIAGFEFSDLTVGHSTLLQAECTMVTEKLTGLAAPSVSEFRAGCIRIAAASRAIADAAGRSEKPTRSLSEIDKIASELAWDISDAELMEIAMHALHLVPLKPGQQVDASQKKPTG